MEEMEFNAKKIIESFDVNLNEGKLYWKKICKEHIEKLGIEAGYEQKNKSGKNYWIVQLDGKKWKRSHIIYFLGQGNFPRLVIDHIDGNSLNDSIKNLRDVSIKINNRNHKKRNIRKVKKTGKYQVRLHNEFSKNVDTYEEAVELYDKKRLELWKT